MTKNKEPLRFKVGDLLQHIYGPEWLIFIVDIYEQKNHLKIIAYSISNSCFQTLQKGTVINYFKYV